MNIALAQIAGSSRPEENLAKARTLAARAAQGGAELLIFPEMFMALPRKDSPPSIVAEELNGPFTAALAELAETYRLHLLAGIWEKIPGDTRVYNNALLVSPEGKIAASYRKIHLFDALNVQESQTMKAGREVPPLVQIGDFHVGVAICYDLRFPELFRALARQGTELIVVPSAWYAGPLKEDHWLTLLRARAIENTCYVAGVNQCGSAFCGRSAVFDPFGVPLADAGEKEGLMVVQAETARITEVREKLPALKHIRDDLLFAPKNPQETRKHNE